MKNFKGIYLFFIPAVLQYILCVILSYKYSFIEPFKNTESTVFYVLMLVTFFLVINLLWYMVFLLISKVKQKDRFTLRFLKFTGIFLAIMGVFYILTFPGIWCNDEFTILTYSRRFIGYGWHHVFTQVIYILGMFFFIHPTLIVLFQIIIISCIVGYLITDTSFLIENKIGHTSKWINLLLIPFLLPPVIVQALYPIRLSLYAFLEVLTFYLIIATKIKGSSITIPKAICFEILIAILGLWRSEAIIFLVLLPILLIVINKKSFAKKTVIVFFCALLTMSCAIYIPQKLSLQKTSLDTSMFTEHNNATVPVVDGKFETAYKISGIVFPMVELAKEAYAKNDSVVTELRKYMDVDKIYANNLDGYGAFWGGMSERT